MTRLSRFFLGVLLLVHGGCDDAGGKGKAIPVAKINVENEGVAIDYEDTKRGDTTLLFVHGWNINKGYWAHQTTHFATEYRVVTVDLPGFGKSGKNRKNWTVEAYARDLTALLVQLDLTKVILIGHSMSGAIVVEAALQNPGRVVGVVGVDNFTNVGAVMTPELKKEIAAAYKALRANYSRVVLQYANASLFSPTTDSAVRKRVINDFTNADSVLTTTILEQNDQYPTDEKLMALGKPIYLINSNFHPTDTSGFERLRVPYQLFDVGPTGHYPMLETPDVFNRQLENVIAEIGKPKPTNRR